MLKDTDIRNVLLDRIAKQNINHDYKIIEELAVCDGDARVDIAVANGKLYGYEIKSDADKLYRLTSQQSYYDSTFDRVIIAVGEKYEKIIKNYIPEYWGIYVVISDNTNKINLHVQRQPKANPNVRIESLLCLLLKNELYAMLKENNIKGISGKNIRVLRSIAINSMPKTILKNYTREILKKRSYM